MPDKQTVFLTVMCAVMLGWMIWNIAHGSRTLKAFIVKGGFRMRVKCQKCGMEYEVPVEEFLKRHSSKRKLKTQAKMRGPVLISEQIPVFLAKKFGCPGCGRREWAQILNLKDYYDKYQGTGIYLVVKQALIGLGGVIALFLIFDIISKIAQI